MTDENSNQNDQDFLGLASEEPQEAAPEPAAQEESQGPPAGHPRWNEVYGKMRHAERQAESLAQVNERLTHELTQLRTEMAAHRESTAALVGDIDEKIAGVSEQIASGDLDGQEHAQAIAELSKLNTERVMVGLQQQAQQHAQEQDFQMQRQAWQRKAVQDFGITEKDMKPELLAKAQQFYQADPGLQKLPNGEYYSLALAQLQTAHGHKADAEAMRHELKKRDQTESVARQAASAPTENEGVVADILGAFNTPAAGGRDQQLGEVFGKHQLCKTRRRHDKASPWPMESSETREVAIQNG